MTDHLPSNNKTKNQNAAAILANGSKKAFTSAALLKFSRLTQSGRRGPRTIRARTGPRAQKKAAAAAADDEEDDE